MKPEKQLYQWDVNQYLTGINPAAQYVDYTIGNEVIRLETDGTRCRIPDEILQTYGGKTCYERYRTEPTGRIVSRYSMHQNRQIMSTPQNNAPHSKP